jgi:hypothetical protein
MNQNVDIPIPPAFTEEELKKCHNTGDYSPILFEWYKFSGELCNFFARIHPESAALRPLDNLHYAVLIGLLNRCSRLMLSNVALSHKGLFGETTAIIDRCIFESSVKIIWLCSENSKERFEHFLADGLKAELKLKNTIIENIAGRNNKPLIIEERMLTSIDRYISLSSLTEQQINSAPKLTSLFDMIKGKQNDLLYTVAQKMGSHHIHGTWPSLLLHYIELGEDGFYSPRDHNCETHVNQYVSILFYVLQAMDAFVRFIFHTPEDINPLLELIASIKKEVEKINKDVVGNDFDLSTNA